MAQSPTPKPRRRARSFEEFAADAAPPPQSAPPPQAAPPAQEDDSVFSRATRRATARKAAPAPPNLSLIHI